MRIGRTVGRPDRVITGRRGKLFSLSLTDCRDPVAGSAELATPDALLYRSPPRHIAVQQSQRWYSPAICAIKTGGTWRINGQFMNRPRHGTSKARPGGGPASAAEPTMATPLPRSLSSSPGR